MTSPNVSALKAAAIEKYRGEHGLPPVNVVYSFAEVDGAPVVVDHTILPAQPDAIRGNEVQFAGAVPDGDRAVLVNDIVQASLVYAVDARRRAGLHAAHRIAITVPFDESRRGLFEDAEATLWNLGVVFDWSLFDTWNVGKELAAGFEPDEILTMTTDGWKVRPDKANPWPPALSRDEVLALVARLLLAQEVADDRNRRMTGFADEASTPAEIASTDLDS